MKSEIHYAPKDKTSAYTVAAAIPGSILKADTSATNGIVLVVGRQLQHRATRDNRPGDGDPDTIVASHAKREPGPIRRYGSIDIEPLHLLIHGIVAQGARHSGALPVQHGCPRSPATSQRRYVHHPGVVFGQ